MQEGNSAAPSRGGCYWRAGSAGEERQRSACAPALAACLGAAQPLEGLPCSLEDGLPCAAAAEDRVELSFWQSSAGQATSRIASQVSPAGTAGFSSRKRRRGKCRCSSSPLAAQPAQQLMCRLRDIFVTQPWFAGAEEPGGSRLPLLSLRAGLPEHVPEASGILCSLRCRPGPGGACTGLRSREKTGRGRAAWGLRAGVQGPWGGDGCHPAPPAHCTRWVQTPPTRPRWLCLPRQQRFGVGWARQHALPTKGPAPKAGTAAVSARGWQLRGARRCLC